MADRVKETVTILKKLQEVGIPTTEPGYLETKALMDTWIREGGRQEHTVFFPRFDRRGELTLPARAGQSASLLLKVIRRRHG
jgi:hypothetical protein